MQTSEPKWKVMRRFGVNLFGTRSPGLEKRLGVPPGQHGRRRRSKPSEYSMQLKEKQKARLMYGANERQFRRAFERARRMPGRTGEAMLSLLERRLDNVTYRIGFAPTRPMSRQLVSHGHVRVNGRRVTVPSYEVRPGDVVTLSETALAIPDVEESMKSGNPVPSWMERAGAEGRITGLPQAQDLEAHIAPQRIVEYYSR
ncbi:MAG TPA: 30S ribosomal protein S4 [Chloroflexota bacterium]|nr:30S ribosomal protein S4 [Chloroflexota bacterium]